MFGDHETYVLEQLRTAHADWKHKLATEHRLSENARRTFEQTIKNLDAQIAALEQLMRRR